EAANLPVGCSFRCQDLYDNSAPNYVGDVGIGINPKLAERVKTSDCLIVVGPRLGEMTTSGYTLLNIPVPHQPLVHVHAEPEDLGLVYQAVLPINSGMAQFAHMAAALGKIDHSGPIDHSAWDDWTASARADYLENMKHGSVPGAVQMGDVMQYLRGHLP